LIEWNFVKVILLFDVTFNFVFVDDLHVFGGRVERIQGATEAHPLDAVDELDEGSDALVEGGVLDGLVDGGEQIAGLGDHGGDEGHEGVVRVRGEALTPRLLSQRARGSGMIRVIRMRIRFYAKILITEPAVDSCGTSAVLLGGEDYITAVEHEVIEDAAFFRIGIAARHGW
jgi:hypothetical protein